MSQAETPEEPVHSAFFSIPTAARIYLFFANRSRKQSAIHPSWRRGHCERRACSHHCHAKKQKVQVQGLANHGSKERFRYKTNQPWIKASDLVKSPGRRQDRTGTEVRSHSAQTWGNFSSLIHRDWYPQGLGNFSVGFTLQCLLCSLADIFIGWMNVCDCFWHKRENI